MAKFIMKALLLTVLAILTFSPLWGQSDNVYQELIARASLCHLQKDYKKAISYYEKAFQIEFPDALTAYKAAGVYSLDGNIEKAFDYLAQSIRSGWYEAELLSTDPYFDTMKKLDPRKWESTVNDALAAEERYQRNLKMPGLRKIINIMTLSDQRLRYKRIQVEDTDDEQSINRKIHMTDSVNRLEAKVILSKYGWPKISEIGKDGQNNLWLVVQHADEDVFFQQFALSAMMKLKNTGELNLENYAFLYDRVQCNLNYKQLYGTQVNWTAHGQADGFRSIIKEDAIDLRRRTMGMLPLRVYALTYGFTYDNITRLQALKRDSLDLAYTRTLIDSAKQFYVKGNFQHVYDFYNTASLNQGGMTNADNYDAALIFAGIANKDSDPKYRGIALDFLNLLYQRRQLRRKQLSRNIFKILQKDARWIQIYNHLN